MRSDPRTAQIPATSFSAFLPEIRVDLIDANIFTPRNHLIARTLIDFLDFSQKVLIHGNNYHQGWTRRVSHAEIAEASGLCDRSVIRGIEEMVNKGVLEKQKRRGDVCFCYRFIAYDRLHQHLKDNPTSDKVETMHAYRSDSVLKRSDSKSDNQEFLKKEEAPTPLDSRPGDAQPMPKVEGGVLNSQRQKGNDADLFLSENSSSSEPPPAPTETEKPSPTPPAPKPRSKVSHSDPPSDSVPNGFVAEVVDSLTEEKRMNSARTVDQTALEYFMNVFKPPQRLIWEWRDTLPAKKLKDRIEALLEARHLDISPALFLKHCCQEIDNRIADGKLDVYPTSFNFFLNATTGKEIIEYCAEKCSHENRAKSDIERTNQYLADLKKPKAPGGIPPEAKAKLDRLLGKV